MRELVVDVFQAVTVLGIIGSLAFGGTIVWCTTTFNPMPVGMLTSFMWSMLLASVGAFALMVMARRRLSW